MKYPFFSTTSIMDKYCKPSKSPKCEIWFQQAVDHCVSLKRPTRFSIMLRKFYNRFRTGLYENRETAVAIISGRQKNVAPTELTYRDCYNMFSDMSKVYAANFSSIFLMILNFLLWCILISLVLLAIGSSIYAITIFVEKWRRRKVKEDPLKVIFKPKKRMHAIVKKNIHMLKNEIGYLYVKTPLLPEDIRNPHKATLLFKVSQYLKKTGKHITGNVQVVGRLYRPMYEVEIDNPECAYQSLEKAMIYVNNYKSKMRVLVVFEDHIQNVGLESYFMYNVFNKKSRARSRSPIRETKATSISPTRSEISPSPPNRIPRYSNPTKSTEQSYGETKNLAPKEVAPRVVPPRSRIPPPSSPETLQRIPRAPPQKSVPQRATPQRVPAQRAATHKSPKNATSPRSLSPWSLASSRKLTLPLSLAKAIPSKMFTHSQNLQRPPSRSAISRVPCSRLIGQRTPSRSAFSKLTCPRPAVQRIPSRSAVSTVTSPPEIVQTNSRAALPRFALPRPAVKKIPSRSSLLKITSPPPIVQTNSRITLPRIALPRPETSRRLASPVKPPPRLVPPKIISPTALPPKPFSTKPIKQRTIPSTVISPTPPTPNPPSTSEPAVGDTKLTLPLVLKKPLKPTRIPFPQIPADIDSLELDDI